MIFALIFTDLEIPFKVMASPSHVYLVANPGSNSTVIETTNQGFERQIFTGEFKQQYVNYMKNSKLISDAEAKRKSVEEIFEEYFKEVRDADFNNLPGFQYYNKALANYLDHEYEEAYLLAQKAYFFYPEEQVRNLLYNSLVLHLDKCSFDSVRDIDYLAQLSKFKSIHNSDVSDIFKSVIYRHLQYTDKEEFCDSLHTRLISQLSDKKLIEDLSFNYYLMMSYSLQNDDKVEKYVINALDIRGNHHDAKIIMENHFDRKLYTISDGKVLLDTISQIEERYDQECVRTFLEVHKLRAILLRAGDAYKYNRPKEGAASISEFETKCKPPIKHQYLALQTESCYHAAAIYYFYRGYKTKARSYVDRGLKYVPNSRLLKSAVN
jgi:tetratricopeptide (TPR) repeat protein